MDTWKTALLQLDLNYIGSSMTLMIDGYRVTYKNVLDSRKVKIMTYVNGSMNGVWCLANKECPEQRFLRPMVLKPSPMDIKLAQDMARIRREKFDRAAYIKEHTRLYIYNPTWPSSKMLVRHLVACNFTSIKVVEYTP